MHMLTWIHFEGGGDAFCKQGLVHELRLVGRHYLVIGTLKKQDGHDRESAEFIGARSL